MSQQLDRRNDKECEYRKKLRNYVDVYSGSDVKLHAVINIAAIELAELDDKIEEVEATYKSKIDLICETNKTNIEQLNNIISIYEKQVTTLNQTIVSLTDLLANKKK